MDDYYYQQTPLSLEGVISSLIVCIIMAIIIALVYYKPLSYVFIDNKWSLYCKKQNLFQGLIIDGDKWHICTIPVLTLTIEPAYFRIYDTSLHKTIDVTTNKDYDLFTDPHVTLEISPISLVEYSGFKKK